MDIRQITPDYAVTPQIEPTDLPAIQAAGFVAVICNRPDMENPVELQADVLRAAAEAAGLAFVDNPVTPGQFTQENLHSQADTLAQSGGPVLAYCASGTRSCIIWAMTQAGVQPTADIVAAAARGGYDLAPLAPQLEALASR